MKIISVNANGWQPENKTQFAPQTDAIENQDCIIIDKEHDQLVAFQIQLNNDTQSVLRQVTRILRHDIKWESDVKRPARMSGIVSVSKVFGTLEPNKFRQRFGCTNAALDRQFPQARYLLDKIATESFQQLKIIEPHRARDHQQLVQNKVHQDWLLSSTPFTSGVINSSTVLPYHRDGGNIAGSWSAMVCTRKNMAGGNLHLPEYNVTLGVPNNSLIWFNGQAVWHGVTPITAQKKDAYRYTIVFYAKQKVCDCLCVEDEKHRAALNAMYSKTPLSQYNFIGRND